MLVKSGKNIVLIGGYKYLQGTKGKWAGITTVAFHVYLKVDGLAVLMRNWRISQGKILPPVSRIAFGRYQIQVTLNRTGANLLHEAVVKAVEEGEVTLVDPLLDDVQEVMSGIMYKQDEIRKLIPELFKVEGVD